MSLTREVINKAKSLGLTKSELAEKIGVAVSTVNAWDNGEKEVYPSLIGVIERALGCDLSAFKGNAMPAPTETSVADTVETPDEPEQDKIFEAAENAPQEVVDALPEKTSAAIETEKAAEKTEEKPADKPAEKPKTRRRTPKELAAQAEARANSISDLLYEKMKATKFNVREIKKNDVDASVKWLRDYGKNLEAELKGGIEILTGAINEINRRSKIDKPTQPALSKQALELAAKFDALSDANKYVVLTVMSSLK